MKKHPASLTPKELASQLVILFSQRGKRWLPDIYHDAGKLLVRQLPEDSQRFRYSKHFLIRTGEALKQKCGVGTPALRWAIRLASNFTAAQLAELSRREVSWTTLRLALRALPRKCEDRKERSALIRQWLHNYDPAEAIQRIRGLIPSERVRRLKAGEKAFVVVTPQGRLRCKALLNEADAKRVARRFMKKRVRIIPVGR